MSSLKNIINIFSEDFSFETASNKDKKPLDVLIFPCCHQDDNEPMTVIGPNINHGPWIAGGAALRWFQGLPVSDNDIDVFCASEKQANEVIEQIKSYNRSSTKYDSDNAVTFSYWSQESGSYKSWTIQVIKRRYFSNLQEVIDNFDITVCQIGTGGNEWLMGKNTAKDIREKNLRMNTPLHKDAVKRLVKYWTYGYRPVNGLLDDIQNSPDLNWKFEADGDYNNAF